MASPMARLQQKKQAAVTTGQAGSTGIPCAMVLRLIRDLPGVPGLIATVTLRYRAQGLTSASGGQDHAISPTAGVPLASRPAGVHRILHPTFVAIAQTPLCDGTGYAKE